MKMDADELNTRHNNYLAAVRKATTYYRSDLRGALGYVKRAQIDYAGWFEEHGIELVFPEEQLPEPLPPETSRGVVIKPWEDYQGSLSYGPSALCYVQSLCYEVMRKHTRPEARRLISYFGEADYLVGVRPENYQRLITACRSLIG